MRTFKALKKAKLADADFERRFDRECHVCITTMKIFEALEQQNISMASLAKELGICIEKIENLKDAEHCDPIMVQQMCQHLSLIRPKACPRLK